MYAIYVYIIEKSQKHMAREVGIEELKQLRNKYEGKLTASLYAGALLIAIIALISVLGILCIANYQVNLINFN